MRKLGYALLLGAAIVATAPWVSAQDAAEVELDASIDGRPIDGGDAVELDPSDPAEISVRVRNQGTSSARVQFVRLEGRVIGLTFFAYETEVSLRVGDGDTETREYDLTLGDLDGQATGLIPSRVIVLDEERNAMAEQSFVADVQGRMTSVYGVFAIVLLVMTAVFLVRALVDLARGRLPANRWARALRFLAPGLGLGLVLVLTLSVFRILAPTAPRWWVVVAITGVVGFLLGYLSPSADEIVPTYEPPPLDADTTYAPPPPAEDQPPHVQPVAAAEGPATEALPAETATAESWAPSWGDEPPPSPTHPPPAPPPAV